MAGFLIFIFSLLNQDLLQLLNRHKPAIQASFQSHLHLHELGYLKAIEWYLQYLQEE